MPGYRSHHKMKNPAGYGRILRHGDNTIMSIVEDKDANIYEKKVNEINTGTYIFDSVDPLRLRSGKTE